MNKHIALHYWVLWVGAILLLSNCEGKKVENPCSPKIVIPSGEEVCECDLSKQYMLGNTCFDKGEYVYNVKFDTGVCFPKVTQSIASKPGIWRFSPNSNDFVIDTDWYSYSPPSSVGEQPEYSLKYLSDGRLEFKADVGFDWCSDCPDICRRTDDALLQVDLYGVSDPGNTKMDIRAIYYSLPSRKVIDTAWIHLYK